MRNPKWHRDEIILALDLYFQLEPGQINHANPRIIEVSKNLNRLPIHDIRPDEVKFRNPNGVSLKLSNFLAIDPYYHGKGMQSFSKLDKKVFDEFITDKIRLHRLAEQIRLATKDDDRNFALYEIPQAEEFDPIDVWEGQVIYKLHKLRERNSKINKRKKDTFYNQFGKLECEACTFDFEKFYLALGKGYIECHHRIPLADLEAEKKTSLDDLALVCSNCHRMLHREISTLSVEELKWRNNGSKTLYFNF